jgi:ATP synthase, F1 epsilon subunit (delta in mitochondria)
MADKITFDLVSPEQLLLSEETDIVTVPGTEGELGVMAGHAPIITTLKPGIVTVGSNPAKKFVVLGGFAEISAAKVTVLAEEAIPAASFDAAALEVRLTKAAESLAAAKTDADKTAKQFYLDNLQSLRSAV